MQGLCALGTGQPNSQVTDGAKGVTAQGKSVFAQDMGGSGDLLPWGWLCFPSGSAGSALGLGTERALRPIT